MESTLIASNTKYLGNWVSKLSQSCLVNIDCIQHKISWKLSLKVVSKLSQS
jgi:hypothetical protein